MNIAILSPNKNSYSETFIQAQKVGLKGRVFYYFDGFIPKQLEGEGHLLIPFGNLRKRFGLLYKDVGLHSLRMSFKKHKIDVVLAQYGPTGFAVCELCHDLNIPLVVHFHGYDATVREVIKKNDNYKQLFKIAKRVIAVSKDMVRDLERLGCHPNKIVYNPYGPNPIFFDVKRNSVSKKQFVALGRFTDKKAPYLTILAFNEVVMQHPDAKLVFGGDGILLNACMNLVKYLKLEANVEFKGIMEPTEFKDVLEESLAFVQHSIKASNCDKEGTPVTVLEASASGLPVISTKHAGIKDVVLHQETGLLSEEQDVKTMTEHMLFVIDNPEKSMEMGRAGRERIEEQFSLNSQINKLQEVLELAADVR